MSAILKRLHKIERNGYGNCGLTDFEFLCDSLAREAQLRT